jgi:hypothetical protein
VQNLERLSKAATIASVALIVVAQMALHPDATWTLRGLVAVSFILGVIGGRSPATHAVWLVAAPLTPALLGILTAREGPVLDLVWMAGLAGSLLRGVPWSTWSVPPTWRVLLGAWALTLSLAWPILAAREIGFDPRVLVDSGAINSWALLSASQVIAWMLYVVLTQLLGVLWLDWVVSRFGDSPNRLPRAAHGLWIGVTVAGVVAIYQGAADLSFLNTPAWESLRRAAGTMRDANAYGMAAAIAGPAAFVMIRSFVPRHAAVLGAVALVVNVLGMWMSGSRTALVCGIAGLAGLAVGLRRSPRTRARRLAPLVSLASAAAIAGVIALSAAIGPVERLSRLGLTADTLSSLWNRGAYGRIAVRMIREYPLTGVGVGSYHILAPDYWRTMRNDRLPFDNAQNWWRHQATELGLPAAGAVFIWSVLVAWRVLMGRSHPAWLGEASTVRGLLIGLGLCSLVGMPTQNPIVLLWFFFLVGWSTVLLRVDDAAAPAGRPMRIASVAAVVVAVAYAGAHARLAFGSLNVVERAVRTNREYVVGAYPPETLPGEGGFRWTRDETRFISPARTPWLVIRLWAHHPDITRKPVQVRLATPCGVAFEQTLSTPDPISIGAELPEAQHSIDGSLRASRTWRPSQHGGEDARRLGVGFALHYVNTRDEALGSTYTLKWPVCGGSEHRTARDSH